jgi:hypothetical protein
MADNHAILDDMARRELTSETLALVAKVYREAPQRQRQRAVGELLGIDGHRASYYINAARKRGYLALPTGDMRVERP